MPTSAAQTLTDLLNKGRNAAFNSVMARARLSGKLAPSYLMQLGQIESSITTEAGRRRYTELSNLLTSLSRQVP